MAEIELEWITTKQFRQMAGNMSKGFFEDHKYDPLPWPPLHKFGRAVKILLSDAEVYIASTRVVPNSGPTEPGGGPDVEAGGGGAQKNPPPKRRVGRPVGSPINKAKRGILTLYEAIYLPLSAGVIDVFEVR